MKNKFIKSSIIFWTIPLTLILEGVFEWTYPYCNNVSDGPSYAAHGFPFPSSMQSLGSSLEWFLMPHVFIVNLMISGLLIYYLIRYLMSVVLIKNYYVVLISAIIGFLLMVISVLLLLLQLSFSEFVFSIGTEFYHPYQSFRPIGLNLTQYSCAASEFWFGEITIKY